MVASKGDLIGIKTKKGDDIYVITQVIKENRFYFCYSLHSKAHSFLVWDPECHYVICPEFDPYTKPDLEAIEVSTNLIAALDKLFGLLDYNDLDTDD